MSFLSKNAGDGGHANDGGSDMALEVTVLSAESLRLPPSYSLLPRRLRPYVSLSCSTPTSSSVSHTGVDETGSGDPSWNDTVLIPVDSTFLEGSADVHVTVLSEGGRLLGPTQLGWCKIPSSDVLDGLRPATSLRRLSYSLRCPRHGISGHGIVHVAVRMLGQGVERFVMTPAVQAVPQPGWCRVAIGIPVSTAWAPAASGSVVGVAWPWGGSC